MCVPTARIAARISSWILIQELICRTRCRRRKLAAFAQHRFESAAEGDEVLNLVGVNREELAVRSGEERVLDDREEQTAERRRLLAELPFVKVQDDPAAAIHRVDQRKRRVLLSDDVPEMRVRRKCRSFVQDRLAHRGAHRLARRVVAKLKVLPDLGVRDLFRGSVARNVVWLRRGRKFKQRETRFRRARRGIAKQLVGARAERIEMPPLPENLGELRDLDEPVIPVAAIRGD